MALRSELRAASLSELAQRESPFFRRQLDILQKVQSLGKRGSLTSSVAERALSADPEHARLTLMLVNAPRSGRIAESPYRDLRSAIEELGWTAVLDSATLGWIHAMGQEGARSSELKSAVWTQQAWATERVASVMGLNEKAAVFLNIGVAGMAAWHGKAYRGVIDSLAGGTTPLAVAEQRLFGHDHAELGASMLEAAGFDATIVELVGTHAQPTSTMLITEAVAAQLGIDGGLAAMPESWEALPGANFLSEKALVKISETLITGSTYLAGLPL